MVTHMRTMFATAGSWTPRATSAATSRRWRSFTRSERPGARCWRARLRRRRGEERRADGLADVEDRKTIQVKRDMAVEGFREAGSLLAWTIYLPKEESDLHCAHECARDFVEDDKCHRRTASLDLPAAKNGVKEGTHKHEVVESSHSCMTVFGRVIPCVEAAGEGVAGC
ncbi:hypothetical protein ERJ75_001212300 [Trypanosoma vivax]|nr:hypothetical protein ERJ75_001212300 [Trypanosoma vivax]